MGAGPELEWVGMGVGALEELSEAREEACEAGQSRVITGIMFSLVMVIPE